MFWFFWFLKFKCCARRILFEQLIIKLNAKIYFKNLKLCDSVFLIKSMILQFLKSLLSKLYKLEIKNRASQNNASKTLNIQNCLICYAFCVYEKSLNKNNAQPFSEQTEQTAYYLKAGTTTAPHTEILPRSNLYATYVMYVVLYALIFLI